MIKQLKRFWKLWLRFGQWMGDQVGRVILMIFYFTILVPFAVFGRIVADPLKLKKADGGELEGRWLDRETSEATFERLKRQS